MQPEYLSAEIYEDKEFKEAYKTYYKTIINLLNPSAIINEMDIDEIYELEKSLAKVNIIYSNCIFWKLIILEFLNYNFKVQMTESETRESEVNIEMTVADLQDKIPDVGF